MLQKSLSRDLYEQACALKNSGQYDLAITHFNESIQHDRWFAAAYAQRGDTYRSLKNFEAALSDCALAALLSPADSFPSVIEAEVLLAQGDLTAAINSATTAISKSAPRARAYVVRAQAHQRSGNYNQAIEDATTAISLAPAYIRPYCVRGDAYKKVRRYDEAIEDFTAFLQLTSTHHATIWVYTVRSDCYFAKGEYDKAFADTGKGLELSPSPRDTAWLLRMRARIKMAQGDFEESLSECEQAIKTGSDVWISLAVKGDALQKLDRHEEALLYYENSIQLHPDKNNAVFGRAHSLYKLKFEHLLFDDLKDEQPR